MIFVKGNRYIFINNNEAQADAMALRLDNKVKHLFGKGTLCYSDKIHHPINGNVANEIDPFHPTWELIEEELNPHDINSVKLMTDDWIIQEEL